MNFLGHLYFSNNDVQLQYANLFGDFVKGSDYSHYSPLIQQGIQLHRAIDDYIDRHPAVLELMHELYPVLPKITGVAVDLYFDHLLAKHWSDFHPTPYKEFIDRFLGAEIQHIGQYDTAFLIMIERMKKDNWLFYYQFHEGLIKACKGLSSRISFENSLTEAPDIFLRTEARISDVFRIFMTDAIAYFDSYFERISLESGTDVKN